MAERPRTPPRARHSGNLPPHPQTPEQIRRTEEARLRAKAARAQHDAARLAAATNGSSVPSALKRTHSQMSAAAASSTSSNGPAAASTAAAKVSSLPSNVRDGSAMTAPAADAAMLRPAHKFATHQFIEYDLSRMTDTKGGFLSAQDDPHNRALHADSRNAKKDGELEKPKGMTVEEWERVQLLRKLRANKSGLFEPALSVLVSDNNEKMCRECGSLEIDFKWFEAFRCAVCKACKDKFPERYSLLTKTEAREDYLLTNQFLANYGKQIAELNDEEILLHLKKTNPHSATWNDMQLYLRYQVEAYAFSEKKWGSPEALDAEFERRAEDKKMRKEKKFKSKLEELKKRTRTDAYRRSHNLVEKGSRVAAGLREEGGDAGEARFGMRLARGDKHVHEWGRPIMDEESGLEVKRCIECGAECEEFEL